MSKSLTVISRFFSQGFIVWVAIASVVGLWQPETFQFVLPHIKLCLGLIMFGMGMTIVPADLRRVLQRPRVLALGVLLQFTLMPLLAFILAFIFAMPPALAVGFIILGCCPGGTASNVICYLARADVTLSVSMTTISTLLATVLTPWLTLLLASQWMEVEFWSLFQSVLMIVLLPVSLGIMTHLFLPRVAGGLSQCLPILSVMVITLLVGAIVGKNASLIASLAALIMLAVVLHNGLGLALGYWFAGRLGMSTAERRTTSIEVGMQNSGLAATLAVAHFSPEAALPAALFSVWHNISGPLLASIWQRTTMGEARVGSGVDAGDDGGGHSRNASCKDKGDDAYPTGTPR